MYARPFAPNQNDEAAGGGRWLVSKGGGSSPHWRTDGNELFYLNRAELGQMAVDVTADKIFQAGVPRRLFRVPASLPAEDISGKRFLYPVLGGSTSTAPTPFNVVLNWQATLKK